MTVPASKTSGFAVFSGVMIVAAVSPLARTVTTVELVEPKCAAHTRYLLAGTVYGVEEVIRLRNGLRAILHHSHEESFGVSVVAVDHALC